MTEGSRLHCFEGLELHGVEQSKTMPLPKLYARAKAIVEPTFSSFDHSRGRSP